MPVAVTLGAQLGVALPSLLVFGRLSLVGTVANLVAVPVAGLVMLYGLPACLLGGAVPVLAPVVVAPVGWGTRWVDAVATVAARLEPPAPWSAIGWVVLVLTVTTVDRVGQPSRRAAMMPPMSVHLLTGDDESILRAAVSELVHELVGDADRSLMVDEFDGDDVRGRRRRRRRPDAAVPDRAARRRAPRRRALQRRRRGPARRLPRPIRCRRPSWCWSAAGAGCRSR